MTNYGIKVSWVFSIRNFEEFFEFRVFFRWQLVMFYRLMHKKIVAFRYRMAIHNLERGNVRSARIASILSVLNSPHNSLIAWCHSRPKTDISQFYLIGPLNKFGNVGSIDDMIEWRFHLPFWKDNLPPSDRHTPILHLRGILNTSEMHLFW